MPKLTGAEDSSAARPALTAPFRNLRGRLGYFAEDTFCALQERATVFSQHQLTRGTMYQVAPTLRSSSAKRSLATDFEICRRLAASLIEPALRGCDEGKQRIQLQHRSVFPDTRSFNCSLDRTHVQGQHPAPHQEILCLRYSINLLVAFLIVTPAFRGGAVFHRVFIPRKSNANGTTLHVRIGGQGAAVLMLHGFGDTGEHVGRQPPRRW